jgi:hypothetical protein
VSFLRTSLVVLALASTSLLGCVSETIEADENIRSSEQPAVGRATITGTYYVARRDTRRCAAPACGGYFVSGVNQALTRCARGAYAEECYVSRLDFSQFGGRPEGEGRVQDAMGIDLDSSRVVLLGTMHPTILGLGTLRVQMAWIALKSQPISGTFYGTWNNGVVCVVAPCPSYDQQVLNRAQVVSFHGLDFGAVPPHDTDSAYTAPALNSSYGLIVAGENVVHDDAGPGGAGTVLHASQVFIPVTVLEGGRVNTLQPQPPRPPIIDTGSRSE